MINSRTTPHYPRQIYLRTVGGIGLQVYFTDKQRDELGYVSREGSTVRVYLLLRDFHDINQLLHAEKEVIVRWDADAQRKLTWFFIEPKNYLVPGE